MTVLITNISNTQSASCNSLTIQSTCEATTNCKWITTPPTLSTVQCVCASESKLDILIGIDGSLSITNASFQIQKQFIAELATQSISNTQRIGFTIFSTTVDILSNIQLWDNYQTLQDFVMSITYPKGWTNTSGLLASAQTQFASISTPDRKKILLLITDGNPCVSGHCPMEVCTNFSGPIKAADIRVIIVGIGPGWDDALVTCLTNEAANDVISVDAFTSADFDAIFDPLSPGLCPESPIVTDIPTSTSPTRFPSSNPTTGPTESPITNAPTRSPIDYKFCTNNGHKGNDNISGKFIMIYDDDGSSDLSYEDVCEFCMCNGVDALSICTNIAEMIKNLNDEMKNAFMDVCGFENECTFDRIGLKPVSKRINRCGCEIFECEPLGGANKALKTSYGFGFIITLISCFVMYYV